MYFYYFLFIHLFLFSFSYLSFFLLGEGGQIEEAGKQLLEKIAYMIECFISDIKSRFLSEKELCYIH